MLTKTKTFSILRAPSLGFSTDLLNDPRIINHPYKVNVKFYYCVYFIKIIVNRTCIYPFVIIFNCCWGYKSASRPRNNYGCKILMLAFPNYISDSTSFAYNISIVVFNMLHCSERHIILKEQS